MSSLIAFPHVMAGCRAAVRRAWRRPVILDSLVTGRREFAEGRAFWFDRMKRLLKWPPQYDISEGIRHSLQWAAIQDEILSGDPVRWITPPPR